MSSNPGAGYSRKTCCGMIQAIGSLALIVTAMYHFNHIHCAVKLQPSRQMDSAAVRVAVLTHPGEWLRVGTFRSYIGL
jgi:hypothetical protein